MPDQDKVIKGLELCAERYCDSDCPYYRRAPTIGGTCTKALLADALALLKEHEAVEPINSYETFRIKKAEDLYNEKIYFMEIKPHKAENGLTASKENELFPVVFYGFGSFHTVKNRLYIRVDAEHVCENTYIKSRLPINGYGVWWRYWEEKPTEGQRQEVKWDD